MQVAAKKLAEYQPENPQWWMSWAYATRRAESLEAARLILVNALEDHADEPGIHFNLAFYERQLANLTDAKDHLKMCFVNEPNWRLMALEDPDLEPLWNLLG